jgi:phenylpropionate dioxygenase-like ring-hydroxylating dioxygenase large terminal subunit
LLFFDTHPNAARLFSLLSVQVSKKKEWVWTKQWYPVAVASDIDPTVPWGTKLLGKSSSLPLLGGF